HPLLHLGARAHDARAHEIAVRADANRIAVERRTLADDAAEELFLDRVLEHPEHGSPFDDQPDAHDELGDAERELLGPVEWIDDLVTAPAEALRAVDSALRQ